MPREVIIPPAPLGGKRPEIGRTRPWLAPLAGYSDLPFRMLCRELGASACVTEMISAKGLFYAGSGTAALLASCPQDQPLVVQLFGGEGEACAAAVRLLRTAGYVDLDFNMGCPVRKVQRQKAGAWLLGEPAIALKLARVMLSEASKEMDAPPARIGFKLRLGVQPGKSVMPDLALKLEDAGASWLTLHPRYASQGYSGRADWEQIALLAEKLAIPLMASGDLLNAEAGLACLDATGASGLMYARGALQYPAIFRDHAALCAGKPLAAPGKDTIANLLLRHAWHARRWGSGRRAFAKLRSLVPRYVRVFRGSQELRYRLSRCEDWDSLEQLILEAARQGDEA